MNPLDLMREQIQCPRCGAIRWQSCSTKSGRDHIERLHAIREATDGALCGQKWGDNRRLVCDGPKGHERGKHITHFGGRGGDDVG